VGEFLSLIMMKNGHLFLIIISSLVFLNACSSSSKKTDYTQYVDPFIGTQHEGHCFPGATIPLGMVQPGPESYTDYYSGYEMDHCTGYQYNDEWIWGFAQTHLNGVGCPSLSDILLQPYCNHEIDPSQREHFKSSYKKETEMASPGYYTVRLSDHHVKVELTASEHVAYHRYAFDDASTAKLLIDLQYGIGINSIPTNVLEANQQFEDDFTLSGYRKAQVWAQRDLYYVIRFNKRIKGKELLVAPNGSKELAPRYLLNFDMKGNHELEVLIGVSTIGVQEAKKNMIAQIRSFETFDEVKAKASDKWNALLSKVDVEGSPEKKVSFYSSLYRMYIQPNNIADIDCRYRGEDGEVKQSSINKYYSTLSLWDTYRAAHPIYTILTPDLVSDLVTSMMDSYAHKPFDPDNPREANKYLPRWQLWGKETHTMVGNHAVPVIVDAFLKGIEPSNYSNDEVFDAIWNSVTKTHHRNHVHLVDKYGYIPTDVQLSAIDDGRETVARLLENTYDDYCAGMMAEQLGKTKEQAFLMNRADYYRNVYDTQSGFFRGKNANGEFRTDVDPIEVVGEWVPGSDFTEGNAYHYLFHVQHDIMGLMTTMGGEKAFTTKLDTMFFTTTKPEVRTLEWNIYGTMGQYWHGNEPCHHVPYLYKYTPDGHKTDRIIKTLVDDYYHNEPDGVKGNDDCGQMSAWYMFASMGFYPVNPCGGEYILGAPQLNKAVINLANGKTFTIKAINLSDENFIVKSMSLNGKQLDRKYITHYEITMGGELVFYMGKEPKNSEY